MGDKGAMVANIRLLLWFSRGIPRNSVNPPPGQK